VDCGRRATTHQRILRRSNEQNRLFFYLLDYPWNLVTGRYGAKYPKVFKAFSGLSSIINFNELEQFDVEDFSALKSAINQRKKCAGNFYSKMS
jgi:hypothetical protein